MLISKLKYKLSLLRCFSKFNKRCIDGKMPEYNNEIKLKIEQHWHALNCNIKSNTDKEKMYILSMFPYPSGQLHMGHMRVYTVADALARFYRLMQKFVIFPMGWDSFGLPAENAAIERGLDPKMWTDRNIAEMKSQMRSQMTLAVDWDREFSTCEPEYYGWTQWIFSRMVERGFAYQRSDVVNWDPIDGTVLADEQVDADGLCWRSGARVERRTLRQWWLRTTAASEDLLEGLDLLEKQGGQWRSVIAAQRGWLGTPNGVYIDWDLVKWDSDNCKFRSAGERLGVFTDRPGAVLAGFTSFVELSPDNVWWPSEPLIGNQPRLHPTLALSHPLAPHRIVPLVLNSALQFPQQEGVSARHGFLAINIADSALASKLGLKPQPGDGQLGPHNRIVASPWHLAVGEHLNHKFEERLGPAAEHELQLAGHGGFRCSSMRKDWLVSRQRRWGTPVPVVHCSHGCGPVLVPDAWLPWTPPLDASTVDCPQCGRPDATPDSDTMDTFLDSSWYFLRFLDPHNEQQACSPRVTERHMPVDLYLGGIEHAVRHLFYARFVSHFLHHHTELSMGSHGPEPFSQFLPIGLVLGRTFRTLRGEFVPEQQVRISENGKPVHASSGELLVEEWDKMSKSKHNGVNPDTVVARLGLDTTRLVLLSNTGPDKSRRWAENEVVQGTVNWEKKLWNLIKDRVELEESAFCEDDPLLSDVEFLKDYKRVIDKVIYSYSQTYTLSVVVAYLQKFTSVLRSRCTDSQHCSVLYSRALADLVVMLYPLSPLLASELWAQLGNCLKASQSTFADTDHRYQAISGDWRYDLNLHIWEQDITGLLNRNTSHSEGKKKFRVDFNH